MGLFFDFLSVLSVNLIVFGLLWVFCFYFGRVSWVDFFWSASIGAWSFIHMWESYTVFQSPAFFVLAALTFLWSKRLSIHLYQRLRSNSEEDRRYQEIKVRNPKSWPYKSFYIFLLNAALVSLLILPQRIVAMDLYGTLNLARWLPALLCLLAIVCEGLADSQLKRHLASHKGKTCQSGLWRYSRHPNYFFEWIFWVGTFLYTLPAPGGYWALSAPLMMFIFLNYLTGIKISEKNAEVRRPDFAEYKRKTSAFFLCPLKKE